eukprot:SAG25_NODE_148_length_13769_cov_14.642648_11_plen_110_part_00
MGGGGGDGGWGSPKTLHPILLAQTLRNAVRLTTRDADSSTDDDSSTDKDARSADQTHTRATALSQAERKRSEALPQPGVPQSRREKVPPPLAFAQDMYAAEDRRCAMQQ